MSNRIMDAAVSATFRTLSGEPSFWFLHKIGEDHRPPFGTGGLYER